MTIKQKIDRAIYSKLRREVAKRLHDSHGWSGGWCIDAVCAPEYAVLIRRCYVGELDTYDTAAWIADDQIFAATFEADVMIAKTRWPETVHAGKRERRRCRATGTIVALYDGAQADMDTEGGRWQTVCEDHGTVVSHRTKALAASHLSHPDEWCEECQAASGAP
jgi:hypothetical protein